MYDKLKGLMKENHITQAELAEILNMTVSTLNFKLNGKSDFTLKQGKKISELFGKPIDEIFFTCEISKMKINVSA